MKIIHVVSLFTPDGAYGGPTRVAINQTRELRARGHDVTLIGGAVGYEGNLPTSVDGVPVTLFRARRLVPKTGFAGLCSPGLLNWFRRNSRTADIIHIHLARDLITLPTAIHAIVNKKNLVVQGHGMIAYSPKPLAIALDALSTRRILRRSVAALCLTQGEARDLLRIARGRVRTELMANGVPSSNPSEPNAEDVLFLARLHPRKRPKTFVEAAMGLLNEFPDARFSLVGPDEGEAPYILKSLESRDCTGKIKWEGALDPALTVERMRQALFYVLPAVDEPFGMTVIEAMSVGKSVIVTNTCALAPLIAQNDCGIVVDDSTVSLRRAMAMLLSDKKLRDRMGSNALATVRHHFSMAAIGDELERVYRANIHPISSFPSASERALQIHIPTVVHQAERRN